MEIFSARLKWLRERKGLTQKEMAELIGMTQSSYSKYEYNLRQPKLETLALLPAILDESVDFMIGAENLDKLGKQLYKDFFDAKESIAFIHAGLLDKNKDSEKTESLEKELQEYEQDYILRKRYFESYLKIIPFGKYEEPEVTNDTIEIYKRINKNRIRMPKDGWPWMKESEDNA